MSLQAFDNRFVAELPGEREPLPGPHPVQGALWSAAMPTPVAAPRLLAHTPELAAQLGFDAATVASDGFAEVFAGNALYPGMQPFAANYGGHQFGHWAGQLGDGRAISLGERIDAAGRRHELQLKGAGRTPYSRGADGRAVLRSSIREFLCSEAMHHLGVPTTRALSLVATGEPVLRDMFYDGHPRAEPGAVVCRVAPSFVRFGSFELPASRGDTGLLRRLVDFVLARDFPHLRGSGQALYAAWFAEVCERTAELVAHWMRVGFVHGVMNTDNMSILGQTLDYGPYGWVEDYDPDWTPNTTDAQGRRYRFGTQPQVAYWNLGRLAQALGPVFSDAAALSDGLAAFARRYLDCQRRDAAAKLGLGEASGEVAVGLLEPLLGLMQQGEMDMTVTFRGLIQIDVDHPGLEPLQPAFYRPQRQAEIWPALQAWRDRYLAQLRAESGDGGWRRERMRLANPCYVLRNYLAQQAIDQAERGDLSGVQALQALLREPYREQPGQQGYAAPRPEWARQRAGCSMLSCSS